MLLKFRCSEFACCGNWHLVRSRNGVGLLRYFMEDFSLWGIKAVKVTCLSLQVAILCQFLREVDYKTAFKALQEQNR